MKKENLVNPKMKKRFVSYREAAELYGIGLTRLQQYAKSAGATYKLGSKVLVNTEIFEGYLEQFRVRGEYENLVKKHAMGL